MPLLSDLVIRDAVDADGPAIAALIRSVFDEYPGCPFVLAEFPELQAPASHYRSKGGRLLVLVDSAGTVLGSTAITPADGDNRFELFKVYLSADLRGGGHARRLFDTAVDWARHEGATSLRLWTDTRFTRGHRFYEKLGFTRQPVVRFLADATAAWEYAYVRVIDP
nr:GNAT family N-acetyltransferase [Mongoliimonas terrestris]